MSVGISLIVIKIESGRLPQSLHSFAMTEYLFLQLSKIISKFALQSSDCRHIESVFAVLVRKCGSFQCKRANERHLFLVFMLLVYLHLFL